MATLSDRILTALERLDTECPLEEIVDLCPDVTWNQIFFAIDHLSRTGQVRLRLDATRTYWVQSYRCRVNECFTQVPAGFHTREHELTAS